MLTNAQTLTIKVWAIFNFGKIIIDIHLNWIPVLFLAFIGSSNAQIYFSTNLDIDNFSDIGTSVDAVNNGYLITASSVCHDGQVDCYSVIMINIDGTVETIHQYSNFPKTMKSGRFTGNTGTLILEDDCMLFSGNTDDDNFLGEIFLLKTNAQGDSIWMKTYGTDGQDVNHTVLSRTDSTLWVFSEADALADGGRFGGQRDPAIRFP